MTQSQTEEEIFTILFEDFDPDLPCENVSDPCSNTAVWRYQSKCNVVVLLCEECHKLVQFYDSKVIGCSYCGSVWNLGEADHWSCKRI